MLVHGKRFLCDVVTEEIQKTVYNKSVQEGTPQNERRFEMSALVINKNNFQSVKESEKPVLLDFYAAWCGPCRMVSPLVDEIAEEREDIVVGKINVDEEPELAQAFGVVSIPTLVVLKSGSEVKRQLGARPKAQILEMLEG